MIYIDQFSLFEAALLGRTPFVSTSPFVGRACLLESLAGSGGASPNPCACANDPKGTEGINLPGFFWSQGGNQ